MRIVIDLQGAQSAGSRNRGIGRYTLSLAKGILRQRGNHEVFLALNGLFPETIESIRSLFSELIPQENIRVWHAPDPVNFDNPENEWRRKSAELVREAFLASMSPDIVIITSLFEGFDNCVLSIGSSNKKIPTAVVLYDLIPLINRKIYLSNPVVEAWYEDKLAHISRADLLLAISESSRQEGITHLNFPSERVFNISTAADPQFVPQLVSEARESEVRSRFGLNRSFVMYTGGIDHRKNIEGLIRAYAQLPKSLRLDHQLAVVCSVQPSSRATLEALAKDHGLSEDELVLTGFVSEDDLITLYNLCKTFVFPSWHEGFGLPALEAMSCGRAVIGANTSSLPEVIGREDALFDPRSDTSIANKLAHVLSDDVFRRELEMHGLEQSKLFSWDRIAKTTITAFEEWQTRQTSSQSTNLVLNHRLKLAYISPLPPERSGIADYSAELLPELAQYYEIDVIVDQNTISDYWINSNCTMRTGDWFLRNSHLYDRVVYHFGNSHFHQRMFELINKVPGIVVLHDFFLSGIVAHIAYQSGEHGVNAAWISSLYRNHGFGAVIDFATNRDISKTVYTYPCNLAVLEGAVGVVIHSQNSLRLADKWLGNAKNWSVIPLLRRPAKEGRAEARKALGMDDKTFMVCSFGFLHPTKLNRRLLDAWTASSLNKDKSCLLVFVGDYNDGEYCRELISEIKKRGLSENIRITGWTDTNLYHQYLAAADIGVQLRTLSRGETSAAVLDCMNYGLATIVNANGSMADLPLDSVCMLPDDFSDTDLIKALEILLTDKVKRNAIGLRASEEIRIQHSPCACADKYVQVIENYYKHTSINQAHLINSIVKIDNKLDDEFGWLRLARDIASNRKPPTIKQLFVDISELIQIYPDSTEPQLIRGLLAELLINPPAGFRTEPVYSSSNGYQYARQFTLRFLNCTEQALTDEPVEVFNGDVFCGLALRPNTLKEQISFYQLLRRIGVRIYFVWDLLPTLREDTVAESVLSARSTLQNVLEQADGVLCTSSFLLNDLVGWLDVFGVKRIRPLKLGLFNEASNLDQKNVNVATPITRSDIVGKFAVPLPNQKQEAKYLLDMILDTNWKHQWVKDNVQRFWGSDNRFGTVVGERSGRDIKATARAGYLLYGPYLSLSAGHYQVNIRGALGYKGIAGARMDVVVEKGSVILGESFLHEPNDDCFVALHILLKTVCTDLEVRVWVEDNTDITISMIEIHPLDGVKPLGDDTSPHHEQSDETTFQLVPGEKASVIDITKQTSTQLHTGKKNKRKKRH